MYPTGNVFACIWYYLTSPEWPAYNAFWQPYRTEEPLQQIVFRLDASENPNIREMAVNTWHADRRVVEQLAENACTEAMNQTRLLKLGKVRKGERMHKGLRCFYLAVEDKAAGVTWWYHWDVLEVGLDGKIGLLMAKDQGAQEFMEGMEDNMGGQDGHADS